MENRPFGYDFPIEHGDIPIAMLVYQRVSKSNGFWNDPYVTV